MYINGSKINIPINGSKINIPIITINYDKQFLDGYSVHGMWDKKLRDK
jgi:hypothetical protein